VLKISKNVGLFLVMIYGVSVFASDSEQFDYPELSVVPRASMRLETEARGESERQWTTFLPVQVSALSTLVAGFVSFDSSNSSPSYVGIGTGASVLAISTILSMTYHPYTSAMSTEGKSTLKGTVRDQLTRERTAEEEIKRIASLGEKIRWISFASNLGASVYMLAKNGDNGTQKNYTAQGFAIGSAIASLAPVIFRFYWSEVRDSQEEYKKRIFAPVANATFFTDPVTQKAVPGMSLSVNF